MRIAFIGPVGVGKTTQAQRFGRVMPFYNYSPRLGSGELIRDEMEADTELGRRMGGHYLRGDLVPDELVVPLVLSRVRRLRGWALDGFPATVAQAQALDSEIEAGTDDGGLTRVFALEGPGDDELIGRVLGRLMGATTGIVYHVTHDPPPRPEERLDPGPFVRREDDTESVARHRLDLHRGELGALKDYYEERGLLTVVDARRPMQEITEDVLDALGHPEQPEFYAARA